MKMKIKSGTGTVVLVVRASGAEQEHSLPKPRVKYNQVWSPNGWMRLDLRFLHSQILCRPNKSPSDETINQEAKLTTVHAKRSHMHVKDHVVHVRVWWTMETTK